MQNIAILHYAAPPVIGGVESVIEHHARLLTKAGNNVRIVAGRGDADLLGEGFYCLPLAGSQHPTIVAMKKSLDNGVVPDYFEPLVEKIYQQLDEAFAGIDLIFAHNVCSLHKNLPLTAALRRYCAQPTSPKLIIWHHDFAWQSARYENEMHAGYPWDLVREDWPEVGAVHVVVSEQRKSDFHETFISSGKEAIVIPSGLDVQNFLGLSEQTAMLFAKLKLMQSDPFLLLPVRITRRKNIELAIEIVSELRQYFANPMLVVTGPPGPHNQDNQNYFRELLRLRNQLGLDPARNVASGVHFMAEVYDGVLPVELVHDFFRMADGILFPSFEEGFGIPMIEAGMAGVPIFASEITSLKAIGQEQATWFAPNGNPAEIARQIKDRLCTDPTFVLKKRIRQNFIWEGVFEKHISPLLEF